MKRIGYLLFASLFFFSCNQEKLKIKGEIEGLADGSLLIKLKTNKEFDEKCIDTLLVENSEFEFSSEAIKPPVRFTAWVNDSCEFDIYIGNYGSFDVVGKLDDLKQIHVNTDDLASEYYAYCNRLDSIYIEPIQAKLEWVKQKNIIVERGGKLTQEDEFRMFDYNKDIKKAQSRRRMAILKTVRANPTSYVMMAVIQKEYQAFNTRHKAEMIKIFRKRFSDTALFWQMGD
ncbi:hypothetical protein BZG02_07845 [Labilibaculum filiforme]|uniref:DUF4369 domain-containing protein n=1 Tax=Labilibaculum filiforme TaxID=1940526 RepID=A0A2N3I0U0_9BACT|nr:DUF4369 domain-containing protein [Labilibaculum filiforme]PKQ63914.1 hypothetical protein BZG02_07845 [Labilibaculum filiforme]